MSPEAISSRSHAPARAADGSGAILRRGAAMSVSPQLRPFGAYADPSQRAEL